MMQGHGNTYYINYYIGLACIHKCKCITKYGEITKIKHQSLGERRAKNGRTCEEDEDDVELLRYSTISRQVLNTRPSGIFLKIDIGYSGAQKPNLTILDPSEQWFTS